jgi:ABC-type lipoprotein release transport system permease subunit
MPRLRQPSEPLPVRASTATRVVASDPVLIGARGSIFAFAIAADIQTQFLVESVTVTLAGSAIGFVVGIIIAEAGTAGFRLWAHAPIYPVMHFSTGLLAAGSAVTVGLIFGTYPARRAAELAPVEAIARE